MISSAKIPVALTVTLNCLVQLAGAAPKSLSPLELRFAPEASSNNEDQSRPTADTYFIPLDTPVDLDARERSLFREAYGGILRFDEPRNLWNARITGWPRGAFHTKCFVKYDDDDVAGLLEEGRGAISLAAHSDEEIIGDHALLRRLFIDVPAPIPGRGMGRGRGRGRRVEERNYGEGEPRSADEAEVQNEVEEGEDDNDNDNDNANGGVVEADASDESDGAIAIFCAAYYIRIDKIADVVRYWFANAGRSF